MSEPTEASVVIILNEDKKVLALRRSADSITYPGYWSFPGGGADPGEDPFECGIRECREETTLEISDLEFIMCNYVNGKAIKFFWTKSFSGTVTLDEENTDFRWVHLAQIGSLMPFIPIPRKLRLFIRQLVRGEIS